MRAGGSNRGLLNPAGASGAQPRVAELEIFRSAFAHAEPIPLGSRSLRSLDPYVPVATSTSATAEPTVSPSPKCLHDPGGIQRKSEHASGKTERRNEQERQPLLPKVARHQLVRNTRSKGSTPAASTTHSLTLVRGVVAASRLRATNFVRRSRHDSRRLHHH